MAEAEYMRSRAWSGGMCTNDVMGHVAVTSLAFGGFGSSGMGSYRGRAGVDTFSYRRSTAIVPTIKDFEGLLEWRYADEGLDEKYKIFKANLEGTEKGREDLVRWERYGVPCLALWSGTYELER
jgi:hypothetical protein